MSTPHNNAKKGDFAKTVLMPGDPLRAKYIAEHYLTDVKEVNNVRNMFGYTGKYKGKEVSVMGSGMGMPSIGIYCNELYNQYGVEKIIRIGSCGSYNKDVHVYDVILVQGACTNSSFARQYLPFGGTYSAISDFGMLMDAYEQAKKMNIRVHVGNILSSDTFYSADKDEWKRFADLNCLAVEMESYALFATAAYYKKKALCILTVSDSLVTKEATTPEEREKNFNQMMEIALNIA